MERVAFQKPKPRVVDARSESAPATGTATCVVGLKFPNGIVLQRFRPEKQNESTPLGYREITVQVRVGAPFTVKGNAQMFGPQRALLGMMQETGGFALTAGVPEDLWEYWYKNNEDSDLVKNGLIFAARTYEDAVTEAQNRSKILSGMEPVDPDQPWLKAGKSRNKNISNVSQGETPASN